jgi:molecular chaperone Hsp33
MVAAGVLMQSNIQFEGALILQIMVDGPVKLAVVEVQSDFALRATASVMALVPAHANLSQMVNVTNQGRCAITLDPKVKFPGQQPYQGVVPLFDDQGQAIERLSEVLEHYMLQSEQLDTTLVLAADANVAAGLLIQRLPLQGIGNLSGSMVSKDNEDEIGLNEHYNRIAILASSLKSEELLTLDVDTILRRLFWEEPITRFEPLLGDAAPRFACSCSRERVARMIVGLGADEAQSILAERPDIEVACEFCGVQYRFDPIDAARLFVDPAQQLAPGTKPH